MRIYEDNDMISAKGKRDMPPKEQDALEAVDRAREAAKCELCTSEVTAEEIAPYRGESRPAIEAIYQDTPKVPTPSGRGCLESTLTVHLEQLTDDRGQRRVAPRPRPRPVRLGCAPRHDREQGECDVLLTLDRGVLHRATAIQRHFGLRVVKPSDLCSEMGWT